MRHEPPAPEPQDDLGEATPPSGPTPFDWGLLVARAAWRRKWIAAAVLLAGLATTTVYFARKQPLYRADAKILAQRQQALPSAARNVFEEIPTRSAWEVVHRRENLVALVRRAGMLGQEEEGTRVARKIPLSQRIQALAGREIVDATEDPLDVLVAILDKKLVVAVDEGTISISLEWPDPQQAYDVVRAALDNFLEARYVQDVRAIDEVISVVQGRAAALRTELDQATDEARRRTVRSPRAAAVRPRGPSEEVARLHSLLESKQRAIYDVEEIRRRRVADLQSQLDQARNTLSDTHPKVVSLRKDIETAARETPQLEALREEERAARKAYGERLAREGAPPSAAGAAIEVTTAPAEEDQRVRNLRLQYEQMILRVNSAQVELDAARAAFKYRYHVIWPPQLPTDPVSPNAKKIFGAGLLASLALAVLAAAAPALLSGRILERWQVERVLRVPIVGDLSRK